VVGGAGGREEEYSMEDSGEGRKNSYTSIKSAIPNQVLYLHCIFGLVTRAMTTLDDDDI
jgi:hypothetical protein